MRSKQEYQVPNKAKDNKPDDDVLIMSNEFI